VKPHGHWALGAAVATLAGCASLWGFDDLTRGDGGAASDAMSDQTSGGSSGTGSSGGADGSSSSSGSSGGMSSSSGASDGQVEGAIDGNAFTDGGCQCSTPSCCGSACQTTHNDGVGQNFYDCNPLDDYTAAQALEACQAYAASLGEPSTYCTDGWGCSTDTSIVEVCHLTGANGTTCGNYCWVYQSNSENGWVATCANCQGQVASWN
jgi:hypothetical protein